MRTIRRRLMVAAVVALLAGMAMTPQLQQSLREFVRQRKYNQITGEKETDLQPRRINRSASARKG
jgi:hypothetical protein